MADSVSCKCGNPECSADPHHGKSACSSMGEPPTYDGRAKWGEANWDTPEGWEPIPKVGAKCPPCVKATPLSFNNAGALDVLGGLDVNETLK